MSKLVDIIIPAYKAHSTMFRCLSSIACQSVIDSCTVTIVNDCCPEGDYSEFVSMFSPHFDIKEVKLDKNGGPGVARQKGIDSTSSPYFTCIDADDTFVGALAIETMLTMFNRDARFVTVVGGFGELHEGLQVVPHSNDMVWMFGKMYKRAFIDRYDIHFNDTRANEDTGFNTKVRLLCEGSDSEFICFFEDFVYYWHEKLDSITRINNCQYSYDQSFCGWTDNMIDAYKFCKKAKPFSGAVDMFAVDTMFILYTYYMETLARNPVFAEQNWEYVKKYYTACFKPFDGVLKQEDINAAYTRAVKGAYIKGSFDGFIPVMSINEFLTKLREEDYDPNKIYDVYKSLPSELIQNNINCGVCPADYTVNKTERVIT